MPYSKELENNSSSILLLGAVFQPFSSVFPAIILLESLLSTPSNHQIPITPQRAFPAGAGKVIISPEERMRELC